MDDARLDDEDTVDKVPASEDDEDDAGSLSLRFTFGIGDARIPEVFH